MLERKRRKLKEIRTEAVTTLKNYRDGKYTEILSPSPLTPHLYPAILTKHH